MSALPADWRQAALVGVLAGAATLFGGSLALRFRSALGLFMGFSSGAVLGVARFDLLPEALTAGTPALAPVAITTATAIGFSLYLALDRLPPLIWSSGRRIRLGPGSLTAHSFMDGLGIGVAFHASASVGWVVAIAVLEHDFIDGADTIAEADPTRRKSR